MKIFLLDRKIKISVRELAEFHTVQSERNAGRMQPWRASLGQHWHKEMQLRSEEGSEGKTSSFEVAIKGVWLHEKWSIEIQGRIDQILSTEVGSLLREIKTISGELPQDPTELLERYPHYFIQLAIYIALAKLDRNFVEQSITGELYFIDINEGTSQAVPYESDYEIYFHRQVEKLIAFANERVSSLKRLQSIDFCLPFEELRPGQEAARSQLEDAASKHRFILFEAPTGFGKTGFILEYALNQMRDGLFERAIYLTGKSTGQLQVIEQLKSMVLDTDQFRFYQLRNKKEHEITAEMHNCQALLDCREFLEERWLQAGIHLSSLFSKGTISLDSIKTIGEQSGICPYELSRAALPYADLWIGDYNYIFSPRNSSMFIDQLSFNPKKTLLIIDEAHNLPSRVASAFSYRVYYEDAEAVLSDLQFAGVPQRLFELYEQWIRFLGSIKQTDQLEGDLEYKMLQIVNRLAFELQHTRVPTDFLHSANWNLLWELFELKSFMEHTTIEKLIWAPNDRSLSFTCLDAAFEIGQAIEPFAQSIFMSATLSPIDLFSSACDLERSRPAVVYGQADWRSDAYDVAIDERVDTRYKKRESYYATTAETIDFLASTCTPPILVFFPSYAYAENIKHYVEALNSYLRIALQPKGLDLNEQSEFLEEALLSCDLLFFVLGSSFSESIDSLGGRVEFAMLVGPALPEVNPVQQAKMDRISALPKKEAFRRVYQVPAMTKINQALGRLVRAPEHRAKILLHCRRFSEASYHELLAPEYQRATIIRTEDELHKWIS